MQVNDLLRILRTRWPVIALVTTLALLSAWVLLPDKLPQAGDQLNVRATSTLVLESPGAGAGGSGAGAAAGATRLNTLRVVASQGEVPTQVATDVGTTVPALLARVTVTSTPASNSLSIVARDRTRDGAVKIADTYSKKLLAVLGSQAQAAQSTSREALAQQVSRLEADKLRLDEKVKTDPATKPEVESVGRQLIAQRAKLTEFGAAPPASPGLRSIGPPTVQRLKTARGADRLLRPPVRLGLASILGIGGSLAALVLIDRLDVRLRSRQAAELAYALPVLAEVPILPRKRRGTIVVASEPNGPYAESHRILRTSLLRADPGDRRHEERGQPRLVVVASADPAEGRTTTAANLAAIFAEAGSDTLLVGLDLRHNDLPSWVPTSLRSDEIQLPAGRDGTGSVRISVRRSSIPNLRLVSLMQPLGSSAVVLPVVIAWLAGIQEQVDVIVVDTPPLLTCHDPSEVIPFADTVLLVCRAGVTTADAAQRAAEVLERLRAPVGGVVLVGAALWPSARKVASYDITGWPSAHSAGDMPRPGDLRRGATPTEPAGGLLPRPVLVPDGERVAEGEMAARGDLPAAVDDRRLTPHLGMTDRAVPFANPAPLPSKMPPEGSWRPDPLPAAGGTPARRTIERIIGRRRIRR